MYTNYKKNDVYKYFYKSEFKKLDIKIHEFISLNNIPFKDKLRVVLWRTRVFNFIKNLKNKQIKSQRYFQLSLAFFKIIVLNLIFFINILKFFGKKIMI